MGSCFYYMKVTFPKNINKKTQTAITKFFDEMKDAYDYWQNNRDQDPSRFWPEFDKKYPTAVLYLKSVNKHHNCCNNGLSGYMDLGSRDDQPRFDKNKMFYCSEVWHFMDWNPITEFIKNHFGAYNSNWVSDEHLDYFDCIDANENNQIIEDVLKRKDLFPLLIGINPDLDNKLSSLMSGKKI